MAVEVESRVYVDVVREDGVTAGGGEDLDGGHKGDCPGRQPPLLAVKRPARPCNSAVERRSNDINIDVDISLDGGCGRGCGADVLSMSASVGNAEGA
jgi:hypothetical protein